jgi:hypothetical protein
VTEIYKNTSQDIFIDFYNPATGTPTATLVRADATTLGLTVIPRTPALNNASSTWQATIPLSETGSESEVSVTWVATVSAVSTTINRYYSIATPYASPYQIASRLGWQFDDPANAGYQDYDRLVAAELISRTLIEQIADQKFGTITKTVTGWGQNTDVLTLPDRIINIKKIYQDDELIYDATVGPVYNYWGYDFAVTDTNFAIRLKYAGINFNESEQASLVYNGGSFKQGSRYSVYGDYGHNYVPDAIFEATILIVNDLMCQDSVYRSRYINNVQVKDWKFTYNAMTWLGTGNALADGLIASQKIQPVWVI